MACGQPARRRFSVDRTDSPPGLPRGALSPRGWREQLASVASKRARDRSVDLRRLLEERQTPESHSSRPTAIDLFAGAGGGTVGLKVAGFRVVAAVENDLAACATFAINHPRTRVYASDIRTLDPNQVARQLSLASGRLTLLKACPPCQGWSSLRRGDTDDPSNALIEEVWRWARALRPRAVLVENVPALRLDQRFTLLVRRLRAVGYSAQQMEVDACDWGAPQRRRRLILIAIREAGVRLPSDLGQLRRLRRPPLTSVADALNLAGELDGPDPLHRSRTYPEAVRLRLEALPARGKHHDLPIQHKLKCHLALDDRSATASYGRLRLDGVAHTITTRSTTPACGSFVHPTQPRGLTLREAALLQTFPPAYRFVGLHDEIGRQIGNALPPRLAAVLGRAVRLVLASPNQLDLRAPLGMPAGSVSGTSWASNPRVRRAMTSSTHRETRPQPRLRAALLNKGFPFEAHARPLGQLPRQPDFVFRAARVAAFLDGCFWHGCPRHYTVPATNAAFWRAKVRKNRRRDRETIRLLQEAGWVTIRVWEHEPTALAAERILNVVRSASSAQPRREIATR